MENPHGFMGNSIFTALNDKERERVAAAVIRKPIKKGEYLVLQGDY